MRIGVIVDGQAESDALWELMQKVPRPDDVTLLRPLYADMQPRATPAQIARAASGGLKILRARSVDRVVVVMDREDSAECPTGLSAQLESAFRAQGEQVVVVIKNTCFENWLIADPTCLKDGMKARFTITPAFETAVSPNRADTVPALALLNKAAIKAEYHKRHDSAAISRKLDPQRAAQNSRSLRRFLRLIGCSSYSAQSRNPAGA